MQQTVLAPPTDTAPDIRLDSIEDAIAEIKAGRIIIVVDDEDRENEGDFICAAETVTPEMINFMATYGRGLICTPMEEKRADELELNLMVSSNTALHETAFTVSIDLIGQGCSTGISAYDRSMGNRWLTNPSAKAADFARPGHIFPLRAKPGGVLRRTGHTEAAVDLARMAGLYPMGVLVEIMNPDGSMARLPQLMEVAREHGLKIVSIDDLVAYRMRTEKLVRREFSTPMDTVFGAFEVIVYSDISSGEQHLVLKKGEWEPSETILVRVHSASETREVLGTLLEDTGTEIAHSLRAIQQAGKGVFVYLRQGDYMPLLSKLNQYKNWIEQGRPDKFELQSPMDRRGFGIGAQILRDLHITQLRLLTNHPRRRSDLAGYGLEIVENVEIS